MDFNLTEGQRMLQKVVREFVEREIEPIAAEIDKTGVFPSETFQKMTDSLLRSKRRRMPQF